MKKPLDFWGRIRKMTTEKITTITCPKCETEIIYLPPDHGYVVIDEVRYLVPQAVCELLQQVSEERDKLREKIGKKDEEIAVLTKFKKAVENDRCTECPFLEKETEREAEIAALENLGTLLNRVKIAYMALRPEQRKYFADMSHQQIFDLMRHLYSHKRTVSHILGRRSPCDGGPQQKRPRKSISQTAP